jgi:hypothetical protein
MATRDLAGARFDEALQRAGLIANSRPTSLGVEAR